jgi:hypothetical protein
MNPLNPTTYPDSSSMLGPNAIRNNLKCWIQTNFKLGKDDVIIEEMVFVNRDQHSTIDSKFRADLAVANGKLAAFEVKSGADTLKRWPSQSAAYMRVFDEVWLCCHGKHLSKALEITPVNLGLMVIDDLGGMAVVRPARINNDIDPFDLTGLLWRDELNFLCEKHEVTARSRDTKSQVRTMVAEHIPLPMIRSYVLARLKVRRGHMS